MNTEGRAVDSIIQFQRHKISNVKLDIINMTFESDHQCTQDDIDNYGNDAEGNALVLDSSYNVTELDISFNELNLNTIYLLLYSGEFDNVQEQVEQLIKHEESDTYYTVINAWSGENVFYALSDSIHLRRYILINPS